MSNLGFLSVVASDPVSSVELEIVQEGIRSNIDILQQIPLLDGVYKTGVDLVSGDNDISHGLGRAYQGMILTNIDTARDLYVNATNTQKDKILILNSDGTATVSIWIF